MKCRFLGGGIKVAPIDGDKGDESCHGTAPWNNAMEQRWWVQPVVKAVHHEVCVCAG
jgi:hypothetical protein